jgi:hypothetical protein
MTSTSSRTSQANRNGVHAIFTMRIGLGKTTKKLQRAPINNRRRVMFRGLRRITVVLAAALTLAAGSIPTNAEAHGFLFGPAFLGAGGWSGGGWGGGGWGGGWGGCGCCCQAPPRPPCCVGPPGCCGGWGSVGWGGGGWNGGSGWNGGGWNGGGWGGGGWGGGGWSGW